jgi:prolipoprotein diacylglyceryltransferase
MALYGVERFAIEFVRAKGDRIILGLSTSQAASILLLVAAAVVWWRQKDKSDEAIPAHAKPSRSAAAKSR